MINIDKKDKRIIQELYRDGRASATLLSSRIGISKEALGYRLKKLTKEGFLTKISSLVDVSALGYRMFRVQLLLNIVGKNQKQKIIQELQKIPEVSWLIKVSGQWDFLIIFLSKSINDFKKIYDLFLLKNGKLIAKKSTSIIFSITHLSPQYLTNEEKVELIQEIKTQTFTLDENQEKILNLLEEDARMPLLQIAKKIGVSITTVKYHLKILEKNKIILAYKPIIKVDKLGYEHFRVLLELGDTSEKLKLREALKMNPHVIRITDFLGEQDLEYEAQYNNTTDLFQDLEKIEEQINIKSFDIIFKNEDVFRRGIPDLKD